jgi:hypothetical protein
MHIVGIRSHKRMKARARATVENISQVGRNAPKLLVFMCVNRVEPLQYIRKVRTAFRCSSKA